MSEQELFLSLIMRLPPKRRDEFWDELVARGIISKEETA